MVIRFVSHSMDVYRILGQKYPAKAHCARVVDYIKQRNDVPPTSFLYLEGQKTRMNEDSDQEASFRQRRSFFYLTGCDLPNCYFVYDIGAAKSTLFIPPVEPEEVIWSGLPITPDEALEKYDVDEVVPSSSSDVFQPVQCIFESLPQRSGKVFAIQGQVPETISKNRTVDLETVKHAIEECRVVKDQYEIALIRRANEISTNAHHACMRAARGALNERDLYALFLKECISHGCKEQAYSPIFASGTAAATLHYVQNDKPLKDKLNLLVDAGGQLDCYAADITRTIPLDGRFTQESRAIYGLVLKMQKECMEMLKAGVQWEDVHIHAHRVAIAGLLDLHILHNGSVEEIFEARTSTAFFPHGLGHYLGLDTHDSGGHANYADEDPMFRYLRVRGTVPANAAITVEPGVYFCRFIIEPALKDPRHSNYINREVLDKYWDVGGVRIEDDVLVKNGGCETLTPTVKEIDDVEKMLRAET